MGDDSATAPQPLLTTHKQASNNKPGKKKAPSIDNAVERYMGNTGSMQLLKAIFLAFAWAFDAQQVFISVFTDAEPRWHCTDDGDQFTTCSPSAASPCAFPAGSWAWDRPAHASMVSEWGLKCWPTLVSLPASSFFAACLAGGFLLATLADSFLGRKKMLLFALASMSAAGALTAFAPNVWAYAALRFVSGFGRSILGTCMLVLSTELVGKRWRDTVSVAGFFFFTVGFLSLPALAYMLREASWRSMYFCLLDLGPGAVLRRAALRADALIRKGCRKLVKDMHYEARIQAIVDYNAQYLKVMIKKEQARTMNLTREQYLCLRDGLLKIFSVGSVSWSDSHGGQACGQFKAWAMAHKGKATSDVNYNPKDPPEAYSNASIHNHLSEYTSMARKWNLGSSLYLSVTYNALAELPASLLVWLFIGRINRRISLVAVTVLAGALSLACVAIPETLAAARMACEIVSFYAPSASCARRWAASWRPCSSRSDGNGASGRSGGRNMADTMDEEEHNQYAASSCAAGPDDDDPDIVHADCNGAGIVD
ncbi:hypothetical protein PR202_ga29597 [Eleusine coracana subsp. coracana]|uniref:Major facilitator superfamily (MFS) profile domain-containing protein n=1 Tax=Eleusine coracana subsp. coracana TaxID=191504 RepID=A0AAV5DM89_ELECO|nr:hypothetical protein PR202_ga29597 [Eleusine coracana subsp. coracana]